MQDARQAYLENGMEAIRRQDERNRAWLPRWVESWDDERNSGNGIIVSLVDGWSFWSGEHLAVKGFDTVKEAKEAMKKKNIYPCSCSQCQEAKAAQ